MVLMLLVKGQLMAYLLLTNEKRLAVVFHFSCIAIESMIFAEMAKVTGKFIKQALVAGTEIEELLITSKYLTEFTHANQATKTLDLTITRLHKQQINNSTPEDVYFDRFYAQMRRSLRLLKHQFGTKNSKIETYLSFLIKTWVLFIMQNYI